MLFIRETISRMKLHKIRYFILQKYIKHVLAMAPITAHYLLATVFKFSQ